MYTINTPAITENVWEKAWNLIKMFEMLDVSKLYICIRKNKYIYRKKDSVYAGFRIHFLA